MEMASPVKLHSGYSVISSFSELPDDIFQVVPMELEEVILQHEGVADVCVTSILNPEDGEWPAAVVVRSPGSKVTAREIQQLIADNLSEHKRLRGGVLFVDELPMTSTGKVARAKVRQLVTSPLK